jgi:hypothetical protein
VKQEVTEEQISTQRAISEHEQAIRDLQFETARSKELGKVRISETKQSEDQIRQQRNQIQNQLSYLEAQSRLLYFYPVKVQQ